MKMEKDNSMLVGKIHTPNNITKLNSNEIFVFGSNEQGVHGKGAALLAKQLFGAINGVGVGISGNSYAIPTCTFSNNRIISLALDKIKNYVDDFIDYAKSNSFNIFYVTQIGCGLAGYKTKDIAPMFIKALDIKNIILPIEFENYLDFTQKVTSV